MRLSTAVALCAALLAFSLPANRDGLLHPLLAQENPSDQITIDIGPDRRTVTQQQLTFHSTLTLPSDATATEILWDFGDGIRTTGETVTHAWSKPGTYTIRARLTTEHGTAEDTATIQAFHRLSIVLTDTTAPADELAIREQRAAATGLLLLILPANTPGPETVVQADLLQQLSNVSADLARAELIIVWTAGSTGINVLSEFAHTLPVAKNTSLNDLTFHQKGIVIISSEPLGVLAPAAQTVFDQFQPSYVLLTRPLALELLLAAPSAEAARDAIFTSNVDHRLLGPFSARSVQDIGLTNFLSFAISTLINRGVPTGNLALILMLPVIATILAFARQFIGLKAFGLITPTMTTLSFLVMGLRYGLIVFAVVLVSGTLTRLMLRRFHLLYLPRMALVLTSVSLGMLALLGLGVAFDPGHILSFSVFPALILMILAEEFIAVQFKSGPQAALSVTAWTLVLSVGGYYIVSWQLFRVFLLSYPEVVLLTIPINIALGRWSGLRLTEYIRFRHLLRYG